MNVLKHFIGLIKQTEKFAPGDLVRRHDGYDPLIILDIIEFQTDWRLASVVEGEDTTLIDVGFLRRWDADRPAG